MAKRPDEARQADAVEWAERRLAKLKKEVDKAIQRDREAKQSLKLAIAKARAQKSVAAEKAVDKAAARRAAASAEKEQAVFTYREASILLRDEKKLARTVERQEVAKQKALATFLKKWGREQEKELVVLRKNIAVRKKRIQT